MLGKAAAILAVFAGAVFVEGQNRVEVGLAARALVAISGQIHAKSLVFKGKVLGGTPIARVRGGGARGRFLASQAPGIGPPTPASQAA